MAARVARELASGAPLAIGELALDGDAVRKVLPGLTGKGVGEALRHLLGIVLEDPRANAPGRLEAALRDWRSAGGESTVDGSGR